MGNTDSKLNFRKAVIQLTTKTQPVEADDEAFWNQFWSECVTCVQDVFTLIPAAEIRALREESPSNLATLCYKAVEKLVQAAEAGCCTDREKQTVLNCIRLLTRVLPYIFEDPDWRGFFWSTLPGQSSEDPENESPPLAQSLLNALSDLLFCPDFTVSSNKKSGPDSHEDIQTIDSCEYIWAAGVGFANNPPINATHDSNRTEILRLLLTCFSETMYLPPLADAHSGANQWISYFTSTDNRHALPLFTSLLNIICSYDPVGYGVPYNHLMFSDTREPLVEISLQVLCVTLDNDPTTTQGGNAGGISGSGVSVTLTSGHTSGSTSSAIDQDAPEGAGPDNLFLNYMSRIHREEDFAFILKGLPRLLNNPLMQTYLPGSCKKIQFYQELLVLFWKMCDINKKFMFYVLKSSDVLDILVPILYHLNDARADQSRVGLMHIGVFILLLLSGERNFGVRLNKPYTVRVPMDVPVFTGTHADFLIIVFHKIITTGHQRLQPLFDCLLTIIVNVSPYLKTLSMVASTKLLHLLEAFSTPWFLYAMPTNHHLVFFLLEVFNNMIQYQFDGNSNLIYTVIRKRNVFHQLANLATDHHSISKALSKRAHRKVAASQQLGNKELSGVPLGTPATAPAGVPGLDVGETEASMEGSMPALEAEPGTLKATLAATPGIEKMTEMSPASAAHTDPTQPGGQLATHASTQSVQPAAIAAQKDPAAASSSSSSAASSAAGGAAGGGASAASSSQGGYVGAHEGALQGDKDAIKQIAHTHRASSQSSPPSSPTESTSSHSSFQRNVASPNWVATPEWVASWKQKLPLQTIMRLLQVLVPQVEKICIDKGLTDESEILKFLQHGTLVGLLPVPHPILIRKYQANTGTTMWFRTYMWGVIYLRNVDPPVWYDTDVKLFEIQRI